MKVHSYVRSLGCLSNIGRSTAIDYSRSSGGLTKLVIRHKQVDGGFEAHRAAVAAPVVGHLHYFLVFFHSPIMRPSGSVKSENAPMPGTSFSSTWILPPAATIFLR